MSFHFLVLNCIDEEKSWTSWKAKKMHVKASDFFRINVFNFTYSYVETSEEFSIVDVQTSVPPLCPKTSYIWEIRQVLMLVDTGDRDIGV
jgi:hypothetical protein